MPRLHMAAYNRKMVAAKPVMNADDVKKVLRVLTRATSLINTALAQSCPNTRRDTLKSAHGDATYAVALVTSHNPHNPTLPHMFVPNLLSYARQIKRQCLRPRTGEVKTLTYVVEMLSTHAEINFK